MGVLAFASWATTIFQIVREPRRTGYGLMFVWCLLITWLFAVMVVSESTDRQAIFDIVTIGPIFLVIAAIVGVAIFLFVNTGSVVRKEGFRLVTLVPSVVGLTLLAGIFTLIALFISLTSDKMSMFWFIFAIAVVFPFVLIPALMIIVELAGYTMYAMYYGRLGLSRPAEAVVVLGAGLSGDKVTPLLASRIDRGMEAFHHLRSEGGDPVLVLSGGKGSDEIISEAEAMSRYARDAGIPEKKMILEDTSTTTEENLRNTVQILAARGIDARSLVVATSNFHVLRAASLTRRLGMPAQVVGSRTATYYLPAGFLREFVATLVHYRKWNIAVVVTIAVVTWIMVALLIYLGSQQTELVFE